MTERRSSCASDPAVAGDWIAAKISAERDSSEPKSSSSQMAAVCGTIEN